MIFSRDSTNESVDLEFGRTDRIGDADMKQYQKDTWET